MPEDDIVSLFQSETSDRWKPESAALESRDLGEGRRDRHKPPHKLFDMAVLARASKAATDDTKGVLQQLGVLGSWRELAEVPDDYERVCTSLTSTFPNFREFIGEHLRSQLALSRLSERRAFSLTPVLLVGAPGIGKTTFCEAMASALSLPFRRINLESTQAGFEIAGVARGWSTAGPGRLVRWLATKIPVNGVFVMEELDKAGGDSRYDAKAPLLQLLEDTTARTFSDQSMPEVEFDVTPVNFVFTANSLEGLSAPLLDRMTIVEIPEMTPDQAREAARRQYARLLDEQNLLVAPPKLTEEALDKLSVESPRRQRQMLRLALGVAVAQGASSLSILQTRPESTRRMGFI